MKKIDKDQYLKLCHKMDMEELNPSTKTNDGEYFLVKIGNEYFDFTGDTPQSVMKEIKKVMKKGGGW